MSINYLLKKEGIEDIKQLDTLTINRIAKRIAHKLCKTFSVHNYSEENLFAELSRLKMFTAKMPNDMSGAKYLYLDKSIYFKRGANFNDIEEYAMHECIHYLQESRDEKGGLIKLGLYDFEKNGDKGKAINEAAVQLMAETAKNNKKDKVKYYDIYLETKSPNYYPLECSILSQVLYFTGDYSLYHSTIYGDNIFESSVNSKLGKKSYLVIRDGLNNLMKMEERLLYLRSQTVEEINMNKAEKLNKSIDNQKSKIANEYFKMQNFILEKGFEKEFSEIKNMEELNAFRNKLYRYKDEIGYRNGYDFYNDYYIKTMNEFEKKREYIENYEEILNNDLSKPRLDLTIKENKISFIERLLTKLKLLGDSNKKRAFNFDEYK